MKRCLFAGISRSAALIIGSFAVVVSAYADVKTINQCTVIDQPGSYRLQKVITATAKDLIPTEILGGTSACIVITANSVTLDLNGYAIFGPGSGDGIFTIGTEAVKVHNGSVTNFGVGVQVAGVGHTVEHINAYSNAFIGIHMFLAHFPVQATPRGYRAIRNTANKNGVGLPGANGIRVWCPSLLLQNVATGNGLTAETDEIQVVTSAGSVCSYFDNYPAVPEVFPL
jgi:hypothetical protein